MLTLVLLRVFLVLLFIAANAFFVAAEFALVSVRDTRIQQLIELRRIGARTIQRLHENFDEVLLAVQFGVTVSSLALGWIGEPTIEQMIEPLLAHVPHAPVYAHLVIYAHLVASIIAFILITYLHVILGEIVPKSIALTRAERVALAVAGPMEAFIALSKPLLYLLKRGSRLVLRAFGTRSVREGGVHSPEELKLIVTGSRRVGLLPEIQEDMIHRSLDLGNVTVREIMVPRPDIFSLPADMPLEEAAGRVVEDQHSRIPVYDPQRGPEHIIGVLYAKDVARLMYVRFTNLRKAGAPAPPYSAVQVRHIMRDVLVVPETKPLTDLLTEFKQRRRHLAVVVDEFGSTAGVVTVEDVLEQVVGELEDEFDVDESPSLSLAGGVMVLDGAVNIRDLETNYELKLPRDEGFETLGGFVISRLQRLPRNGDSVEFDGRKFTVVKMEGHRIELVRIEAGKPSPAPATQERAS
ncbi:MAG TPA: hemolysin family protein [Terriglobales bacterium]|jgi:putative hemolysin|nr:hemolysin family protein [Terriglobales bacterium]